MSTLDAVMSKCELAIREMRDKLDVHEEHMDELNSRDEGLKGEGDSQDGDREKLSP